MKQTIVLIKDFNEEVLRTPCPDIALNQEALDLVQDLKDTLAETERGIGLSANQIGIVRNVFIIKFQESRYTFINPRMLALYGFDRTMEESCLSCPKVSVKIERPAKCEVEYYNEKFELKKEKFSGMLSRIVQHEYDHLQGKLIVDYKKETV